MAGPSPAIAHGSRTADAIVVLGCRVRGGEASAALRRRVECGVGLYRSGAAPRLLLSGGGPGPVPEAEIMRRLAAAAGVPAPALVVEPRSRNTCENARETAALLRSAGFGRVILVSDRTHLPRATLLFRLAGIAVIERAAPPPASVVREFMALLRELLALPPSLWRAFLGRDG